MYGITIKYKGSGCYRFMNNVEEIIYVGSAKYIHRRLSSYFNGSGSHLGKGILNEITIVEIIKTNDYATALALEQYLINKYKPKYNKKDKDHNINSKVVTNEEYYDKLENWQLYYELQKLDKEKINLTKKQDKLVMAVTYAVFVIVILMLIF